jgi:RNA-directed DNA polymerase
MPWICCRRAGVLQGKAVRQRLRAHTQGPSLLVAWQDLPWKRIQRPVFRLQKRMSRATPHGQVSTGHKLQKLLRKSWDARLLAVRRITQDKRGKPTAGIDGRQSLPPPQRWRLATTRRLTGHAAPRRRTWMPKRGSPAKRPLGRPTQADRACQPLVRQALEPDWEAKRAPHTSGFRPGRSCWEAIAAILHGIKLRPPSALKVAIATCFARLCHPALLAKTQASPAIRRQRKAWVRAGLREHDRLLPTTAGTPQGGRLSPLLALLALHGMEEAIPQLSPRARVIA